MAMSTKQMNGSMKLKLTAGSHATCPKSMMAPCIGGMRAPPTMAITRNAAPSVESSALTFSSAMP